MISQTPRILSAVVLAGSLMLGASQGLAQETCLSGQWCGRWCSQANGHQGRLTARFQQINACQVQATFGGTFAKVFPFRYRTTLQIAHQEPGLTILQGSKRVGPFSGEFHYRAEIRDGQFQGTFHSCRNQGTWNMTQICR